MSKEKKSRRSWWMEFMTGVMATAIGVGLSFAVNNMVENHKKDLARRHTAMMAIYDIDEIVHKLREYRQKEENIFKIAMYADTHQNELDSISIDSLRYAVIYLTEDKSTTFEWADDSKEKAFNSSMDAWQNLENTQFYDNVLSCYRMRGELLKTIETEVVFKRPLSDEEFNRFFMQVDDSELDYSGSLNRVSLTRLLKQVLQQPTTTRYLRTFFLRNHVLTKSADDLALLNQENKVLMDISDKDIEDYIKMNVDKTRPATFKKLVGKWESKQDENRTELFVFNPDNSASLTSSAPFNVTFFLDEENKSVALNCPISFSIDGTWDLVRDSLMMRFDSETCELLSFDIDLSNLPKSALERQKDSLEVQKENLRNYITDYIKQADWDIANKVSLDMTGKIMFLSSEHATLWGQTETERQQLIRTKAR